METKKKVGKLLIAAPKLFDPNFYQTVILLVKDEKEGSMGLVLNRPTDETVKSVLEQIDADVECKSQETLHVGGPVYGPLAALHELPEAGEVEVLPGLWYSADSENLTKIIESGEPFRLYSNYTGWGEGQLEYEINSGGWQLIDGTKDYVFDKPNPWVEARRQCGNSLMKSLGLDIKGNPSLN